MKREFACGVTDSLCLIIVPKYRLLIRPRQTARSHHFINTKITMCMETFEQVQGNLHPPIVEPQTEFIA